MTAPAKRGRGRPPGSRNKNRIISGATVEHYCLLNNHNPTKFLIDVAKGKPVRGFVPTHEDVYRANVKLHDSIHNKTGLGKEALDDDATATQFEIVYFSEDGDFTLPGEEGAEGAEGALREEPVQRAGVSPEDGQDSVRHQPDDTGGANL